eukprot:10522982-Prorocentrum_lima.AAC.1
MALDTTCAALRHYTSAVGVSLHSAVDEAMDGAADCVYDKSTSNVYPSPFVAFSGVGGSRIVLFCDSKWWLV